MKRPVVLIVGAAAGALILAASAASAHTALFLASQIGQHSSVLSDEASGARVESPEPTETPEAPPTAEPTEQPEPTEAPEPPETEPAENDNHDNQPAHSGDGGGGDHSGSGGGGND